MGNILIFRSANYGVMEKLLQKISGEHQTYCIMQKSAVKFFEEKYSYVKPLILAQDYIEYDDFMRSIKMPDIKFDKIYLPTSSKQFVTFGEALRIIRKLKYKELIYFDRDGIEQSKKNTIMRKLKEKLSVNIFEIVFYVEYFFYGIKKRISGKIFLGE